MKLKVNTARLFLGFNMEKRNGISKENGPVFPSFSYCLAILCTTMTRPTRFNFTTYSLSAPAYV